MAARWTLLPPRRVRAGATRVARGRARRQLPRARAPRSPDASHRWRAWRCGEDRTPAAGTSRSRPGARPGRAGALRDRRDRATLARRPGRDRWCLEWSRSWLGLPPIRGAKRLFSAGEQDADGANGDAEGGGNLRVGIAGVA